VLRESGQHAGGARVELPDVPEPERAQEHAERRRGTQPGEQPRHRTMPHQTHVRNRIRAGDHAAHQRGDLGPSGSAGSAGHRQQGICPLDQTRPLRQRQHRHQAG
jgi:hypothetical protein